MNGGNAKTELVRLRADRVRQIQLENNCRPRRFALGNKALASGKALKESELASISFKGTKKRTKRKKKKSFVKKRS